MPEGRLKDKTALVTGAGSGIGKAISVTFGREGANVVASDINEEAARATAAQIEDAGGSARAIRTDTTSEEDVKAAIQSTADAYGGLDIMVNNAGIGGPQYTWEQIISVNERGVYYGCLHAFAQMQTQRRGGAIVNMASMMGLTGWITPFGPGGAGYAYHASKHAVIGLTRQFGLDGAPHNIRVNAICPGWIETPLLAPIKMSGELTRSLVEGTPMNRLGQPEEIAKAALFLASDDSSFMTSTYLVVDGGWTAR
ncbi:MAG TPA: glucose 1-dehydrogenase [Dehalococcoidia bacterium]|nr:glucose 1-dehydrogenase [Dehalococcoidia bacterium]